MLPRPLDWYLMVLAWPPAPCKSTKSRLPDADITKGRRSLHLFYVYVTCDESFINHNLSPYVHCKHLRYFLTKRLNFRLFLFVAYIHPMIQAQVEMNTSFPARSGPCHRFWESTKPKKNKYKLRLLIKHIPEAPLGCSEGSRSKNTFQTRNFANANGSDISKKATNAVVYKLKVISL